MPLTLNVGLSRKIGEANYGSRGACVNFEVEVESTLIREPEALKEKVRYLFALAKDAVEEELNGQGSHEGNGHVGNGHNGNGNGSHPSTQPRLATASQVRAIHAIAGRNRIDLEGRLRAEFSVSRPDDLLIGQASELIDVLKSQTNGAGGRR